MYNGNTPREINDDSIDDRIDKFVGIINTNRMYRIPLRYFCGLGQINLRVKIDCKIRRNLETDMKKLFEIKKK